MWIWALSAFCAFFIKGLCGFANTLVFTAILGFGTDNVLISPVELLLGLPANAIMVWKNRVKLSAKLCFPLIVLVLLGSIPGALLLKNGDAGYIKIVFGAVVVLCGVEMLLRGSGPQLQESRVLMAITGVASGVLCGLFGVGALMAAYVSRVSGTGDAFKANMSAVFLAENLFRVLVYALLGMFTSAALLDVLRLLPFVLMGLLADMAVSRFVKESLSQKLVSVLLVASGIALITAAL